MDKISTTEARQHFSDLVNKASFKNERIRIERNGKILAALISLEDLELLEAIEDMLDIKEANAAKKRAEKEGYIPWEEVKRKLNR